MRDTYLANMNMAKERAKEDSLKEKENERRKMIMIQEDLKKEKERTMETRNIWKAEIAASLELKNRAKEQEKEQNRKTKETELELMKTKAA